MKSKTAHKINSVAQPAESTFNLNENIFPLYLPLTIIRKTRTLIRKMRINPINALLSPIQRSILAATYGQPEKWWYMRELANVANRTPSSLQRDLKALSSSGILRTRKDGSRLYYQAETDSPIYEPLKLLIERTIGVREEIRSLIESFSDRIETAFIYGSTAREDDTVKSDIDVIIIGSIGLADIAGKLRKLEHRFKRELNVKCYNRSEFDSKIKDRNHFVLSILNEDKIFLIGNEDDLARSDS